MINRLCNLLRSLSQRIECTPKALLMVILFFTVLLAYSYKMQYRLEGHGGDTLPAQLMPISVLRATTLDFNGFFSSTQHLPDSFHVVNGKVLSIYPILPGIMNIPVYWIATRLGLAQPLESNTALLSMISASIITALSVSILFLTLVRLGSTVVCSILLSLLYAFGTAAWSTASRGIWQHGPSLLLLSCAFFFLCGERPIETFLCALFCGLAVVNRFPNLLLVTPLLVLAVYRMPILFPLIVACFVLPLVGMRFYSSIYYGQWWYPSEYPHAFQNLGAFKGNVLEGLAGLLISPTRGLLIYSPILAYAFYPGYIKKLPLNQAILCVGILLSSTAYMVLHASWYMWWGGTCYGYRLLTELLPGLFILLSFFLRFRGLSSWALNHVVFIMLCILSIYANLIGGMYYPCAKPYANRLDGHNPWLWSIKDSDLIRCSEKLIEHIDRRF